jgi:hypothetical protein
MFKYQAIDAGTRLHEVARFDALTGQSYPGEGHVATKGYIVTIFEGTVPLGVVFQTEVCGKQWVAIDRFGHFWSSYSNTREHAAQWLLKRARA